jgi:hypothetical protein
MAKKIRINPNARYQSTTPEMDGKRWKNGKTGIWAKIRENGTGFGANFPFSRPLHVFLQSSVTQCTIIHNKMVELTKISAR